MPEQPRVYYRHAHTLRCRSVGATVLTGTLDIPALPARLLADCAREVQGLGMEAGDVQALSLPRARVRWPDYKHCVQAVSDWLDAQGLGGLLPSSEVALMACQGARFHHDAGQYGGKAFCNLFLGEAGGQVVHFAMRGQRIDLQRGRVVVFDTAHPHAVLPRDCSQFRASDFSQADSRQYFLTWELPLESKAVQEALGVQISTAALALEPDEEQVRLGDAPARVSPESGEWLTG